MNCLVRAVKWQAKTICYGAVSLSLGPIARQSLSNGDSPQDLALQQATSKCQ